MLIAIVLGVLPVTFAALALSTQSNAAASARYGSTIADRLAASAVDPLLADDLIGLSLLVREYKALDDVATAAVYSAERRLLAAADGTATSPARLEQEPLAGSHIQAIRLDESVAGYARIALRPPPAHAGQPGVLLAALAAMVLLTAAGVRLGGRLDLRLRHLREEVEELTGQQASSRGHLAALLELGSSITTERETEPVSNALRERQLYVLIVNLFNQISLPASARHDVLDQCEAALEQVCRLYGGRQEGLPRTGILVTLDALSDSGDHAFHAICAALLAQRVFANLNAERVRAGEVQLALRIGLERVSEDESNSPPEVMAQAFPDSVSRGITLSALARNEAIAIGDGVLKACSDPERLIREPLQSAALRALGGSGHAWLIRDLAPGYRGLLERQAQLLLGSK
ncbi:MAG: hypothetical protein JJU22_15530 [Gammaproteobacteria bacterium]|nr:hypothetical protein [Gammaproteobacteria bacterium]